MQYANLYFDLTFKDDYGEFDNALLGVRQAIEWLAAFSGQEQNYILPLSVKALVKDWDTGLNQAGGSWQFTIGQELFPGQWCIRLRGLCVSVVTDDPDAIFQAVTSVPEKAAVISSNGKTSPSPLEQGLDKVPPNRIGRIQQLNSVRAPDVVGALTLHNVSPISFDDKSPWQFVITSSQTPPILSNPQTPPGPAIPGKSVQPKDVYLHLLLAIRSIQPGL